MLQLIGQVQVMEKQLWSLSWHPSGTLLAVAGSDRKVTLLKLQNNQLIKSQVLENEHTKSLRTVAFSPSGKMLAFGSFDSYISVFHISLQMLEGHESEVKCVSWSPSQKRIASASRDKNVWIWEYEPSYCQFVCVSVLEGHSQDVKWVHWINEHKLVSASYDDTVIVWEKEDDDFVNKQLLSGHSSIVWALQSIGQQWLFSVSEDKSIRVWQDDQGKGYKLAFTVENAHLRPVYTCSLNNTKSILATSGGDNSINLYSTEKLSQHELPAIHHHPSAHSSDVNCIRFHPSQNLLLSCGDDKLVKLWRVNV